MTNFEPITMVDKELSSLIVKDKKNIYDLKWQLADSNPHYCSYTDSEIVSMYCMNKKQYIGVLINNNFQNSLITEMQYGQAKKMIPGLSRLGYGQYEYCLSYKSDKFKVYMTDSVIDKMRDENLKLERKRVNDSFLYMKDVILGDKADDIKMSFNFLPHAGTINGVELIDDEKILSYNVNRCFFPISPMEFDNVEDNKKNVLKKVFKLSYSMMKWALKV